MMRRSPIGQYGATSVRRERDRAALRRQIVLLVCGMLTACGFVLAAGQRFKAVRYGYQSEQLREERERLVAERERLTLELTQATAPGALEQAARGIGMQPARASQIGDARRDDAQGASDTSRAADAQRGPAAKRADDVKRRAGAQAASHEPAARQTVIETRARVVSSSRPSADGAHAHAVMAR
jgi:cell division protein FtsL